MRKRVIICLLFILAISSVGVARTIAYWQLDNDVDRRDAIDTDDIYFDLTEIGDVKNAATDSNANPVPNPSVALWRSIAGDGDPCTNSLSQGFSGASGDPDGWWRDGEPNTSQGDFEYVVEKWPDTNQVADSELLWHSDRSFTAECWIKPNNIGYIMGNRSARSYPDDFHGWHIWLTAGGNKLWAYFDLGDENDPSHERTSVEITEEGITFTDGQWRHIAVVWDHDEGANGTIHLYIDGNEVTNSPKAGDSSWAGKAGGPFQIGVRANWVFEGYYDLGFLWDYGMHGGIDEIRIVDEALDPNHFLNGTTPYLDCGETGYLDGDLNEDCEIDGEDLELFIKDWLKCTKPGEPGCIQY